MQHPSIPLGTTMDAQLPLRPNYKSLQPTEESEHEGAGWEQFLSASRRAVIFHHTSTLLTEHRSPVSLRCKTSSAVCHKTYFRSSKSIFHQQGEKVDQDLLTAKRTSTLEFASMNSSVPSKRTFGKSWGLIA